MKKRMGFVSNSSSSSFLIFVDKKPESAEETQKLFLGDDEQYLDPYYDPSSSYFANRTPAYPAEEIGKYIYTDLENQKPLTPEGVAEELSQGYLPDDNPREYYTLGDEHVKKVQGVTQPEYESFKNEKGDIDWEAYQKERDSFSKKVADIIVKKNEGKEIYRLTYSDEEGGQECAMEHGTLFDRVDHFTISKH